MNGDYSWKKSAGEYAGLYSLITGIPRIEEKPISEKKAEPAKKEEKKPAAKKPARKAAKKTVNKVPAKAEEKKPEVKPGDKEKKD